MALDKLIVRREHNLKNVDLEIPFDKLVVITGFSAAAAKQPLPSTPSTPKASAAMLNRSRHTPGNSSV